MSICTLMVSSWHDDPSVGCSRWSISLEMDINCFLCDGSSLVVILFTELWLSLHGAVIWFSHWIQTVRDSQSSAGSLLLPFCIFMSRALGTWRRDTHLLPGTKHVCKHLLCFRCPIQEEMWISSNLKMQKKKKKSSIEYKPSVSGWCIRILFQKGYTFTWHMT